MKYSDDNQLNSDTNSNFVTKNMNKKRKLKEITWQINSSNLQKKSIADHSHNLFCETKIMRLSFGLLILSLKNNNS